MGYVPGDVAESGRPRGSSGCALLAGSPEACLTPGSSAGPPARGASSARRAGTTWGFSCLSSRQCCAVGDVRTCSRFMFYRKLSLLPLSTTAWSSSLFLSRILPSKPSFQSPCEIPLMLHSLLLTRLSALPCSWASRGRLRPVFTSVQHGCRPLGLPLSVTSHAQLDSILVVFIFVQYHSFIFVKIILCLHV